MTDKVVFGTWDDKADTAGALDSPGPSSATPHRTALAGSTPRYRATRERGQSFTEGCVGLLPLICKRQLGLLRVDLEYG